MADQPLHDDLQRYWDAVLRGEPAAPGDLDLAIAETIRRLRTLDHVPPPDLATVGRIREELMNTATFPVSVDPTRRVVPNGRVRLWPPRPFPPSSARRARRPSAMAHLATAALLLLTLAVGLITLRSWSADDDRPPAIPAVLASPEAEATLAGGPIAEALAAGTFAGGELPAGVAQVDYFRFTLDPGLVTTRPPGDFPAGVRIDYVVAGDYTARVDGPLLVARGGAASQERIAPGTEVRLGPGDAAIYPANDRGQTWGNAGAEPLVLLVAGIFESTLPEPPAGLTVETLGAIAAHEWAGPYAVPAGAMTMALQRLNFSPGAELPEYTPVGPELIFIDRGTLAVRRTGTPLPASALPGEEVVIAVADTIRVAPGMRTALRNPGAEPLVLLVLAISPVAGAEATPRAGTPAP